MIAAPTDAILDVIITKLSSNIELKSGPVKKFLGLQIALKKEGFTLNQSEYITSILKKYQMDGSNPCKTPQALGFTSKGSPLLKDPKLHKEIVGCLIYLATCSRPDIAYALGVASRVASPTEAHLTALKRILRYLNGTVNLNMFYRRKGKFSLEIYSDSDYANDESRKSISGSLITLNSFPIIWKSRLQNLVTLPTTEAELVAGCDTVKAAIPIQRLLKELKFINEEATPIYIDNSSTIQIMSDERTMCRTKHIDVRSSWLHQAQKGRIISVRKIDAANQKADIFTKNLSTTSFIRARDMLSLLLISSIMKVASASWLPQFPEPPLVLHQGEEISYILTNKQVFSGKDDIDSRSYVFKSHAFEFWNASDTIPDQVCWSKYQGPQFVLFNGTSNCFTSLTEEEAIPQQLHNSKCQKSNQKLEKLEHHFLPNYCTHRDLVDANHVQAVSIGDKIYVYCLGTNVTLGKTSRNLLCPEYVWTWYVNEPLFFTSFQHIKPINLLIENVPQQPSISRAIKRQLGIPESLSYYIKPNEYKDMNGNSFMFVGNRTTYSTNTSNSIFSIVDPLTPLQPIVEPAISLIKTIIIVLVCIGVLIIFIFLMPLLGPCFSLIRLFYKTVQQVFSYIISTYYRLTSWTKRNNSPRKLFTSTKKYLSHKKRKYHQLMV